MPEIITCNNCIYRHEPYHPKIFDSKNLSNSEILDFKLKKDIEQREIARLEKHRFDNNIPFDYKPKFYSWCEAWTEKNKQSDYRSINTDTGEERFFYALCAKHNTRDNPCTLFEQK